jgi:hypothetical protein
MTMYVQTAEPYIEPPNDVAIKMATSKLKNGKATGHDQIPAKLIKGRWRRTQECILQTNFKNI